jgi:hypothetical protein
MAICCLTQLYQVVTRLQYDEQERDVFESAFGYTVNRDWVTRSYFSEIASQVSGIGNGREPGPRDPRGTGPADHRPGHPSAGNVALLSAALLRCRLHRRRSPARSDGAPLGGPGEHGPGSHARLGDAQRRLDPAAHRAR